MNTSPETAKQRITTKRCELCAKKKHSLCGICSEGFTGRLSSVESVLTQCQLPGPRTADPAAVGTVSLSIQYPRNPKTHQLNIHAFKFTKTFQKSILHPFIIENVRKVFLPKIVSEYRSDVTNSELFHVVSYKMEVRDICRDSRKLGIATTPYLK